MHIGQKYSVLHLDNNYTFQTNTFQCILATNRLESFVIFLYAKWEIQWTTGDRSRRNEALAGIDNGSGITIPGSQTPSIKEIAQTTNIDVPGIWVFKVGQGVYMYST